MLRHGVRKWRTSPDGEQDAMDGRLALASCLYACGPDRIPELVTKLIELAGCTRCGLRVARRFAFH
jgi:hypothetical protein